MFITIGQSLGKQGDWRAVCRESGKHGSEGVAPSKHGGIQWHENATLLTPNPPVSTESCTQRGQPPG